MATFRRKRSKKYKSRTKSRRKYSIKRRGKKTLRGGGILPGIFGSSKSRVAPTQASSLPKKNVSLDEDINNFNDKIEHEITRLKFNKNLQMYIHAITTTSTELAQHYIRLMLEINKSKPTDELDELVKKNKSFLDYHISALDSIYRLNGIEPLNKLKDAADQIAIDYYTGLSHIIKASVN